MFSAHFSFTASSIYLHMVINKCPNMMLINHLLAPVLKVFPIS